jgi:spore coat protein CotH
MNDRPGHQRLAVLAVLASLTLGGCAVGASDPDAASTSGVAAAARDVADGAGVWDASEVHEISIEVDEAAVAAMIDTYQDSGEKEWLEATVTIDGETFQRAGIRLKGNSSLRGVDDGADGGDLPWLIRLDKFVDDQSLDGWTELVVRSNSTETALNEALALDLLAEAGLASEHAVASSFSVNGADARLRLVVQHLDEEWEAENFSTDGLLYKAEAGGDWSWRGDDPEAYVDVFDQETGDDDLTPLIDFLDFINNSSDEDFAAELPERLDVEAFARYLAFEEVVDNFDDIDGPGNNSYLRWDAETGAFTVVAWDHNLAFGAGPGGGAGMPGGFPGGDGERPEGMPTELPEGMPTELPEGMPTELPEGMPTELPEGERPDFGEGGPDGMGGGMGGPGGRTNVLVERFTAVEEWADLVEQAKADLTEELYDSGYAEEVLDQWVQVLTEQAGDLVDADTVEEEADAIREAIAG